MVSSLVDADSQQVGESPNTPRTPRKLKATLLERWNSPSSAGSTGSLKKKAVSPFWNCSYNLEGNASFAKNDPNERLVNKTSIKKQNEKSIRDYKQKNLKDKKVVMRTPSRGMSVMTKPPMLIDIVSNDSTAFQTSELSKSLHDSSIMDIRFANADAADLKMIRSALKKNAFFNRMDSQDLIEFVESFEHIEVSEGIQLFKSGDPGDYFYIVGMDSIVEFEEDGVKIGKAEDGESFGELSLIYSCPRAGTATAMSAPTDLYRVDRKTFKNILQKQTKSQSSKKMKLLKGVDFLSEMSEFELATLGRAMRPVLFKPGDVLVKKGEKGSAFYMINKGQIKITDISVGGTKFDDRIIGPGDYFGERSLATNELTAANVVAITKGFAFRIDRKTFERVLGEFQRVIMKAQDRKILEGIPIFDLVKLTKQEFEELACLVVDKTFRAGEKIFSENKLTNAALYIVREGTVTLSGERSDSIKPGAYFGEDLLLLDSKQGDESAKGKPTMTSTTYTAVAKEDCTCGVLSLSECRTIFETTKMAGKKSEDDALEILAEEVSPRSLERKRPERSPTRNSRGSSRSFAKPRRHSSTQWLKKKSKCGLRCTVQENIKLEDLKKLEVLGTGQFGEVFLVSAFVSLEYGKQLFALKTQQKNDTVRGDSVAAIRREIDLLAKLDHPYIVNLVHYYESPEELHILMGAVYGGELFDVIHTENADGTWTSGLPESDAKFYAMVVTDTLDYMHRKQFIYRDLKPENVLIDEDGYPIICDFGFAKFVEDKTYTLCGTPNYLSPEIIMNIGHNWSTDHWALGILIYEMVAGENPFYYDGISQMDLLKSICGEKFYPLPDSASDEVFQVVEGLLQKDPTLRLGSKCSRGKEIIAKDWFKELTLDDLREKKYKAPYIPDNETMDRLKVDALADSAGPSRALQKAGSRRRESGFRSSIYSS
mmetsp:Transcript_18535/g.45924  ORF Transcript_18535/g.45924 Transcript_18535/m.45924 type:complete len:938 (+) Transcript_18535:155-2968(+)